MLTVVCNYEKWRIAFSLKFIDICIYDYYYCYRVILSALFALQCLIQSS